MNVTLEKTGELEGVVVVKLVEEDYKAQVKNELKEIGKKRQIPGFRPGHIDMAQLQKRFGKEVKAHVLNEVSSDAALKYIEDNKFDLLGQPLPLVEEEYDLTASDFVFKYEIGLAPTVDIKLDQSVVLDYYNIAVDDKMIADQDTALRNQGGEQVPAQEYAERALVKGVIRQLDEEGNEKEDGIKVEDGIIAPFHFTSKEQAEKFEGSKVGDTIVFDVFATCDGNEAEIASMLHIDRDKVESARGNFQITISEFIVHKPAELGQEFYDKVFGKDTVHNEEEYRQRVREMIARALEPNSRQLFARMAEDYLMETYGKDMQLPLEFLKKFMTRNNNETKPEDIAGELERSIPGIKWEIIENKAAEALKVEVNEDDVKAFAHAMAIEQLQSYGMAHMADQMADYLAENILKDKSQRQRVVRQAFNGKLINTIHNTIKLNEKTVSLDEFRAFVDSLNKASGDAVAAEEQA